MLAIEGLALGLLSGLIASLIRYRNIRLATRISVALGIVFLLYIFSFLLRAKSAQGDDAQMAFVTVTFFGIIGTGILAALALAFGALQGMINGQTAWKNAITLLLDITLMLICSILVQTFIISSIRLFDVQGLRDSKAESERKIQALHNQMPPPYSIMDLNSLRSYIYQIDHEIARPGPPVSPIVTTNLKAIDEIERSITKEPDVASYTRDSERRVRFHLMLGLGWLVSAFAYPIFLKRRDRANGSARLIPPVSL